MSLFDRFARTEQEGYAPETGQRDHRVDDTANEGVLPAENPRHDVELKQTDAAPVCGTDDDEKQCDSVHDHVTLLRRIRRRSPL